MYMKYDRKARKRPVDDARFPQKANMNDIIDNNENVASVRKETANSVSSKIDVNL